MQKHIPTESHASLNRLRPLRMLREKVLDNPLRVELFEFERVGTWLSNKDRDCISRFFNLPVSQGENVLVRN
jgi:hypothetical protein